MPLYRDEAVVLRTHKLGEADRIVTMLVRQHGKIRAVAKGVRRTASKFGARLEPFMVVDVQCTRDAASTSITQAESLGSYGADIAGDYASYTAATVMVETADKLTDDLGSLQQYLLLVGALRSLARQEHGAALTLDSYLLRALAVAGWAPSFVDCAVTGAPGPHSAFVVQMGGVVADDVAPPGSPRLDPDTIDLLAALLAGDWQVADAAERRARSQASGVVAAYTQFHLERSLRSLEHVDRNSRRKDVMKKTHKDAVDFTPIDWTGIYPPEFPKGAVPEHVAIVMDGNGRWANERGLPRVEGHRAGEASLLDVVAGAIQIGVKHLSVYAFSTENWRRSPDEVRFLMGFNRDVLHRRRDQLNDWGVRVRWAGRKPRLWASVIKELQFAERLTAGNSTMTLTMCVNYGGRNELTRCRARESPRMSRRAGCKPSGITEKHDPEAPVRSPTCPTSTCSCAARGSSAPATSCCGRARTPRWCSSTPCGRTSRREQLWEADHDLRPAQPPLRRGDRHPGRLVRLPPRRAPRPCDVAVETSNCSLAST